MPLSPILAHHSFILFLFSYFTDYPTFSVQFTFIQFLSPFPQLFNTTSFLPIPFLLFALSPLLFQLSSFVILQPLAFPTFSSLSLPILVISHIIEKTVNSTKANFVPRIKISKFSFLVASNFPTISNNQHLKEKKCRKIEYLWKRISIDYWTQIDY